MAVSARGLAASYGKRDALRGVSLDAPSGSITALCGANGSGKTTLCKVLAGLIQPRRGEARILGRTDTWAAKADVCYHSARPFFEPGQSVLGLARETARLRARYDLPLCQALLERFAIPGDERLGALSKGRLALAMFCVSLAQDARVYLLDEPFGGIDLKTRDQMREALLARVDEGRAFLVCTHELGEMEGLFDRLVVLREGKTICEGWADDLREEHGCSLADLLRGFL